MIALKTSRASLLAFAFCYTLAGAAQIAVPPVTGRVTDQTATLSAEQKAALEQTLQAFEARKGSQLAVLIVPTTSPETIEQYALRVAEQWKLGRKKVDDGAILVVAKGDRTMRLEIGYGLEGALNDATSKRIISEIITPAFAKGDWYGGIAAGLAQMISVIDGEALPAATGMGQRKPVAGMADIQSYIPVIFMLALVVGGLLRSALGRFPGALVTGGGVAIAAWLLVGTLSIAAVAGVVALFFTLLTGGMGGQGIRGAYGALGMGGLGRGGGFGGGGGGFGGGGGGFGGGGATGRW